MTWRLVRRLLSLSLALSILWLGLACAPGEAARPVSLYQRLEPVEPTPSPEALRIAVASVVSPRESVDVYLEVLDYIESKLGRPVELVLRKTYGEVNDLLRTGEVGAAFVCTRAYVEGRRAFGLDLLVAPRVQGQAVYHSYTIVPADSPARSLEELRGKAFAFSDPLSNTGQLVPAYRLAQIGETPETFFGSYIYTYSHSNSIKSVARKLVDGAAVDSLVYDYVAAQGGVSGTKIIEVSRPFPSPPFVASPRLDPGVKEQLRTILLGMTDDPAGRAILQKVAIDDFIVIEDAAFDSIRQMLEVVANQRPPAARP